jgi:hypothetical protein
VANVDRATKAGASLQSLEVGAALFVQRHHLAVEQQTRERQGRHRAQNLRECGAAVVAVPGEELRVAAGPDRQDPVTVELGLEEPVLAGEGAVGGLRQHEERGLRLDRVPRCLELDQLAADRLRLVRPGAELLHGEPAQHRLGRELASVLAGPRVPLLDEEPVLLALLELHQRPHPMELVSLELEQEFAVGEPRERIAHRKPLAPIPHDDSPRAVVAGGNHPFEVAVFEGMVLDVHREPLLRRVVRGLLGHRPGAEHPFHLEP